MLFCHLAHARSLREICYGLSCCNGKLRHLGIMDDGPKRSPLAYANQNRDWRFFQALFHVTLDDFRAQRPFKNLRKKRFRFRNKLLSLDSSVVSLCLEMFPWADYSSTKGGVKLHVLLDHDDYLPRFVRITEANVADMHVAHTLNLPRGSIVAMDRGYNDYKLFADWTGKGVFFVTRLKKNASHKVRHMRKTPEIGNVKADEEIVLTSKKRREDLEGLILRKITARDPEKGEDFVILTNNMTLGATTISAIFRDRREIEKFFRLLKQNLKIKTFVGTSENALQIQIWTAMIALLLIRWLHYLSKAEWSFSNMAVMFRMNLFTYRDLRAWLDDPFETPPQPPGETQMTLEF